tara:strand:+ start:29373 stop:29531 length:159 start_codon:yes stop_codon:yes gene_type:complete
VVLAAKVNMKNIILIESGASGLELVSKLSRQFNHQPNLNFFRKLEKQTILLI